MCFALTLNQKVILAHLVREGREYSLQFGGERVGQLLRSGNSPPGVTRDRVGSLIPHRESFNLKSHQQHQPKLPGDGAWHPGKEGPVNGSEAALPNAMAGKSPEQLPRWRFYLHWTSRHSFTNSSLCKHFLNTYRA